MGKLLIARSFSFMSCQRRSVRPEAGAVDFFSTKIILRLSHSKSEKELRELGFGNTRRPWVASADRLDRPCLSEPFRLVPLLKELVPCLPTTSEHFARCWRPSEESSCQARRTPSPPASLRISGSRRSISPA